MKVTICFLAIVSWAVALPAEVPFEFDLSKLTPINSYVEPIQPVKTGDIPPGSRIIGGHEVAPNSLPYQVAVIINGNRLCGGSLISWTRVLSAAHCTINASYVQLRLGAHYLLQNEDHQVRITSSNIINHESYNGLNFAHDVSVILLSSVVPINDYINVVPLASAGAGSYVGEWGIFAGWGTIADSSTLTSPNLRGVYLGIISNAACRNSFGDIVLDIHICTSGAGTVGGCNGDSGGPLVVDGVQVGIGSFQASRCEGGFPTGFTRISSYRSWIAVNAGV